MKGKEVYSMKGRKRNIVLSFLLVLGLIVCPNMANAAGKGVAFGADVTISDSMDLSHTTLNDNEIKIANNGTSTRVYLGVQVTEGTIAEYNVTLKLGNSNFTFERGTRSNGWEGTFTPDENDPSIIHVSLKNKEGVGVGLHQVASIRLNVKEGTASTETCNLFLEVPENETPQNPTCEIVDGKYYDDNGVEVTKEEYEAICLNPENPQTGSFLPYAVILGGVVVAIGIYMFTKKNKIYHI